MLSRSTFITLDTLRPNSLTEGKTVNMLLTHAVCLQIRRSMEGQALTHLPVYYNYEDSVLDRFDYADYDYDTTVIDFNEVSNISHILSKAIESIIEEFNIYHKYHPNSVLNFSSIMLTKANFVFTAEIIGKD